MVARFYIDGLFDITMTIYEAFLLLAVGTLLVYLLVAVVIREISIRKFLRKRSQRRQKLGKVKKVVFEHFLRIKRVFPLQIWAFFTTFTL